MQTKARKAKGFTLIEVIVVIAIITVLSTSLWMGFSAFGQNTQVKETAKIIQDLLNQLELEVSQGFAVENKVSFEKGYLKVRTQTPDSILSLSEAGLGKEGCKPTEIALKIGEGEKNLYLKKTNEKGDPLEISVVHANEIVCIPSFMKSSEVNWNYQLLSPKQASNLIRFLHFNLRSSSFSSEVKIVEGTDLEMQYKAPYGQKTYFKNGIPLNEPLSLTLSDVEGHEEVLMLP